MQKLLKVFGKISFVIIILSALVMVAIPPLLYTFYRRYVYVDTSAVPKDEGAAMVLGTGINSNALQDRLNVATTLYKEGKISTILVSGTRNSDFYDEPKAMTELLVKAGVPEEIITQDGGGYRTFDSCLHAKETFKLDKLIVISQGFHLPRALFLCRALGIDATGVYSVGGFSTYYSRWNTVREVLAMYRAVWDVVMK